MSPTSNPASAADRGTAEKSDRARTGKEGEERGAHELPVQSSAQVVEHVATVAKASAGSCASPGFAAAPGSLPKATRPPTAAAVPSLRRKARRLAVAGAPAVSSSRTAWTARRGPSTRPSSRAVPRPVQARTSSPSRRTRVGAQAAPGPSARRGRRRSRG